VILLGPIPGNNPRGGLERLSLLALGLIGDLVDQLPVLQVFSPFFLELVVDVRKRELRALAVARLRDAVGDRAIVQDARDEQALAGEKSHAAVSGLLIPWGLSHQHGCRYGSCRL